MQPNQPAPPTEQNSANVWISKEEYERLRALEYRQQTGMVPPVVVPPGVADPQKDVRALQSQRTWQVVLGSLLALALYFSVVSGAAASVWLVLAIVIFGGISLADYFRSHQAGVTSPAKPFKHNPYKILVLAFAGIAILPSLALVGLFIIFMTLGGGDVGS